MTAEDHTADRLQGLWITTSVLIGCWSGLAGQWLIEEMSRMPPAWLGVWLSAGCCALILSLVVDANDLKRRLAVIALTSSLLMATWIKWAQPQRGISGMITLSMVCLIIGGMLHFGELFQQSKKRRLNSATIGLVGSLVAFFVVQVAWIWLPASWKPILVTLISVISTLVLLGVLMLRTVPFAGAKSPDPAMDRRFEFETFRPLFDPVKTHFVFFLFLALGSSAFALIFASGLFPIALIQSTLAASSPWFSTSLMLVLGAFSARPLMRHLGIKRALTLVMLLWTFVAWAFATANSPGSLAFLTALMAFLSSLMITCIITFAASSSSQSRATAFAAWSGVAGAFGAGLGSYINPIPDADQTVILAGVLQLIAIVHLQWIRGESGTSKEAQTAAFRSGTLDAAGDWPDMRTSGAGRHRFFSRLRQAISRVCVELFFGRIDVRGFHHLAQCRGAVLVANQPNSLLDALLIAAVFPGRLHTLAQSTLWRFPVLGSILDRLRADGITHTHDPRLDHRAADPRPLASAVRILRDDGYVLFFPEGAIQSGLTLKPIKIGVAKLAFRFGRETQWQRPIHVVPIGLEYSEPSVFRSSVTISVGQPLDLADFRSEFEAQATAAVLKATREISDQLKALLPHLDQSDLEHLVDMIEDLYGEKTRSILNTSDPDHAHETISEAVHAYHDLDADSVWLLFHRLKSYIDQVQRWATPDNHPPIPKRRILSGLRTAFSPITLGLIANWLPYRIAAGILDRFFPSRDWVAVGKLSVGTVVFATYYLVLALLSSVFFSPLVAYFLVIIFLFSGVMALGSLDRFVFRMHQLKTLWKAFWTQNTDRELDEMRIALIQDLERFRVARATYTENQDLKGGIP